MIQFILPKNIVKLYRLIKDWFLSTYILIKEKCLSSFKNIVSTLYLRADSLGSRFQPAPTFSGLPFSIQKKQLQFLQTKEQLQGKCSQGLHSCLRIFHSFCNRVQRPLTKGPLSFPTTLVLSLLLHLAVLSVVFLSTYSTSMSLLLLSVLLSSILLLIRLYLPVKTPRSSLHPRPTESEIRFIKYGKARLRE